MNLHEPVPQDQDAMAHALTLMRVASDPDASQKRLEEIAAATAAHDAAREAAEKAFANADEKQKALDVSRDAVKGREVDFHAWVASKESQLQARENNIGHTEQKLRVADSELQRRENELQIKTARHNELIAHLKQHLANIGA
jgi:chromosome segregation ATPase